MQHWLIAFSSSHIYLIYPVIVVVSIFEGPVLSIMLGVLLRMGYLSVVPVLASVMVGDLIGDTVWYRAGYRYGRAVVQKYGTRFGITDKHIDSVEAKFHRHSYLILFISKVTNGFGLSFITLITAGIVRIPLWKFLATNAAGQLFWSGVLLFAGYAIGESFIRMPGLVGKIALGVVLLAAAVYFIYKKTRSPKTSEKSL